jgi:hypothetical protein
MDLHADVSNVQNKTEILVEDNEQVDAQMDEQNTSNANEIQVGVREETECNAR